MDITNSSQDDDQGELVGLHSNHNNIVASEITSNSCEDLSDSRPCVDCAVKDSPSVSADAYIDLSDSTYTFFNESPDKGNKGWSHPPVFSLGFTLSDNLLRSCLKLGQLRYLRHFGVVPSSKEPPNMDKFLKNRQNFIKSSSNGAVSRSTRPRAHLKICV